MRTPHCSARRAGGAALLLWAAAALLLGACSPHVELYPKLDELALRDQYLEAAQLVEKSKDAYGDRNAVLYNLDRGLYYHHAGRYKESNAAFELAERRMDDLYTESVTGNVAAFALNDNTLPYRGEDFETVLVNVYRALNYIALGQVDEALVEARKVNLKLEAINDKYPGDAKNVYKEDAFARLLAGVLYEMGGTRNDVNDAFISDRLAVNAYANDFAKNYRVDAPEVLARNLLSTALFMGPEELRAAQTRYPGVEPIPLDRKRQLGQLYLVHFAGKSPVKVEDSIRAVMPDGNLLKVAFPRYRSRGYLITGARVQVDGQPAATLQAAQPIGAIAKENLENRRGRIAVKAIARATAKYIANRALQERARKEGQAAGVLGFIAGTVFAEISEQADLRSWQTLPDLVLIGRVLVPPGKHRVQVQFTSGGGAVVATRDLGELELAAGQTRFVMLHTLR